MPGQPPLDIPGFAAPPPAGAAGGPAGPAAAADSLLELQLAELKARLRAEGRLPPEGPPGA